MTAFACLPTTRTEGGLAREPSQPRSSFCRLQLSFGDRLSSLLSLPLRAVQHLATLSARICLWRCGATRSVAVPPSFVLRESWCDPASSRRAALLQLLDVGHGEVPAGAGTHEEEIQYWTGGGQLPDQVDRVDQKCAETGLQRERVAEGQVRTTEGLRHARGTMLTTVAPSSPRSCACQMNFTSRSFANSA